MSEHLTHDAVMGHLPSVGPTDCDLSLTKAGFTTPFCCPGAGCGAGGEEAETVLRAARRRSGRLPGQTRSALLQQFHILGIFKGRSL